MYDKLEIFLSKYRLEPYLLASNNDKEKAIELYNYNISLSKSLYLLLNYFEIILRNACNNKLIEKFKNDWMFNNYILDGNNPEKGKWAIDKIKETDQKIKNRKNDNNISYNDIVSNLDFGFWTNLFCANYEHKIWRPCLMHIFNTYTRKDIYNKLNKIKELRNRIFHYEPIVFDKNLKEKYNNIIEIISFLTNKETMEYLKNLDEFKKIYNN